MVNSLVSMNLEHLDVIYTPSYHILKIDMIEHSIYNSSVTQAADIQLNDGTHPPRNSNIVHLQHLINIIINLSKDGHQVLNL